MHHHHKRLLLFAALNGAAIALWAVAAVHAYTWQLIWLPAAILGATWPRHRKPHDRCRRWLRWQREESR